MTFKIFRKNKIKHNFVDPDEIFLDSKNIQNFDTQQFEGRLEKAISKNTINILGICFILITLIFSGRLVFLQIQKGEAYYQRSQNNTLEKIILFAERGIIYDRNKVEMAWNKKAESNTDEENGEIKKREEVFGTREYLKNGFAHILGYVSYPAQDKKGNFWQGEFIGKDGLEKQYNDSLKGLNGAKIIETDASSNIHSENTVNMPKRGADLVTTIDSRIQKELFTLIKNAATTNSFTGGAGVIMDVTNGEILVATSYPEYDGEVLSFGKDATTIKSYFNDKRKVFMDRNISGLYTPGSIVKPIFALAALNEGIISPFKEILSTGSISIPNPYFKDQKTVFKDWKAHGWTNMAEAIAVSSDVYFYSIGGGFEDQKGLGIANLEKYTRMFGIGDKTNIDLPDEKSGTIPSIDWKLKTFKNDPWRVGDTYNTSIGQYGFQVTPMEIVRAISAIANRGTLVTPHLVLGDSTKENLKTKITLKEEDYDVVHAGMRQTVTYGTGVALNVPYVEIAAKTGTAQLGLLKNRVNSWVVGFFPYENPKYAFTIMMESGPASGSVGASSIMRGLVDWMNIYTPEYFK